MKQGEISDLVGRLSTSEIIELLRTHKVNSGGVYKITNTIFGRSYYGQTRNLVRVYDSWKYLLNNKSNRYPYELCIDYIDFTTEFTFEIVRMDICQYKRTKIREHWLEKDGNVYNLWKTKEEWSKCKRENYNTAEG